MGRERHQPSRNLAVETPSPPSPAHAERVRTRRRLRPPPLSPPRQNSDRLAVVLAESAGRSYAPPHCEPKNPRAISTPAPRIGNSTGQDKDGNGHHGDDQDVSILLAVVQTPLAP